MEPWRTTTRFAPLALLAAGGLGRTGTDTLLGHQLLVIETTTRSTRCAAPSRTTSPLVTSPVRFVAYGAGNTFEASVR